MKIKGIFLLIIALICSGLIATTLLAQTATNTLPKKAKWKHIEYKTTDYVTIGYVHKNQFVEGQNIAFFSKLTLDTIISGKYYTSGGNAYLKGIWKQNTENGTTRAKGIFKLTNSDGVGLTIKPKEGKPLTILVDDIENYQGFRREYLAVLEKKKDGNYFLKVDYVGRDGEKDLIRLELIVNKKLIDEYGFFAIDDFIYHTTDVIQTYNDGTVFIGKVKRTKREDGLAHFEFREGKFTHTIGEIDEKELIKLPDDKYKYRTKYSDRRENNNFAEVEMIIDQPLIDKYGFWATQDYVYYTSDVKYTFKNGDVFIGKVENVKDTINGSVSSQLTEGQLKYHTGEVFQGSLNGLWFCDVPITGKMIFLDGSIENGNWLEKYILTEADADKVTNESSPTDKRRTAQYIDNQRRYKNAIEKAEYALTLNDYQTAKHRYLEALKINPDKSELINKQIDKVEKLLEKQRLLNSLINKYGEYYGELIYQKQFAIGMTKAMAKEIIKENEQYYKKSISTSMGKQTEIWEFDNNNANAALGLLGGGWLGEIAYLGAASIRKECPTLVFKNGKLTDIYR